MQEVEEKIEVTVENIGGIDKIDVEFIPGVNILRGENANNKTSLLQGIMAAYGSNNVSLKRGENIGESIIKLDNRQYKGKITRENGDVIFEDDRDTTKEDLFAFLTKNNRARRAVEKGEDLRDIVLDPLDLEEIEREERKLRGKKMDLDKKISRLEKKKKRIGELKSDKNTIEKDLKKTRSKKQGLEEDIEKLKKELEEEKKKKGAEKLDKIENLEELKEKKADINKQINQDKKRVEHLKEEIKEIEEDLSNIDIGEKEKLEEKRNKLTVKENKIQSRRSTLDQVISFNQEQIEEAKEKNEVNPKVECWGCGSEISIQNMENHLESLEKKKKKKNKEFMEVRNKIEEIEEKIKNIRKSKKERKKLKTKLRKKRDSLDSTKRSIKNKNQREKEIIEDINKLEEKLDYLNNKESQQDRLDKELENKYDELSEIKAKIRNLENRLDEKQNQIDEAKKAEKNIDDVKKRRQKIQQKLETLRDNIRDKENKIISEFNEKMKELTKYFGDELSKIWIEKEIKGKKKGSNIIDDSIFRIRIERENGREDTVENLSESEREIVGLIFGLSGYLAYNLDAPLLLDSLGMFDVDNLERLLEEFNEESKFIIATVLPKKAEQINFYQVEI